jgi:hypothetical protein
MPYLYFIIIVIESLNSDGQPVSDLYEEMS